MIYLNTYNEVSLEAEVQRSLFMKIYQGVTCKITNSLEPEMINIIFFS